MKKLLIIFVFTGIIITLFYACKKNTETIQTNTNTEQKYTDYEWKVFYKLQSFKQKLNSNLKGTDPMTLDSTKWYLETNFNVDEAYTEDTFRMVRLDTTYYTLPLNRDELVEYSDMNAMYNMMLSDLDSLEGIIADPYVFPFIGILNLVSNNSSEAYFSLILGFGNTYSGNYISIEEDVIGGLVMKEDIVMAQILVSQMPDRNY